MHRLNWFTVISELIDSNEQRFDREEAERVAAECRAIDDEIAHTERLLEEDAKYEAQLKQQLAEHETWLNEYENGQNLEKRREEVAALKRKLANTAKTQDTTKAEADARLIEEISQLKMEIEELLELQKK